MIAAALIMAGLLVLFDAGIIYRLQRQNHELRVMANKVLDLALEILEGKP